MVILTPEEYLKHKMSFKNNPSIFLFVNFCMGPFKWSKATKFFMISLLTHNFTSHGAHKAPISWPKAIGHPQEPSVEGASTEVLDDTGQ